MRKLARRRLAAHRQAPTVQSMCAHTAGSNTPENETDGIVATSSGPDWKNDNVELRRRYINAKTLLDRAVDTNDCDKQRVARAEIDAVGDAFYKLNRGLAHASARRFVAGTGDLDDYVSAASLGLWEAFLRWDPERAVTFSTFSRQYIAGRVQRAVRQVEFSHLTQHEFNLRKRIRAAQAVLAAKLERPPTMEEIAQEAEVPLEKVNKTLSAGTASLDTPIGDGDGTLADVVAKVGTSDTEHPAMDIEEHLDELSALELWVISARSDIYDGDNQSLVEVSDTIGIGREIARRAETRGKLRLHAAAWAAEHGRNPSDEELAKVSGKTLDHVREYHVVNYVDAKRRWRRITMARSTAQGSVPTAIAEQRLARLGEELIDAMRPLAVDLGRKRADKTGYALGTDEASWMLFQAFLAWDENSGTSFPTWARKYVNQRTSVAGSTATDDDPSSPSSSTWTWIRRQLSHA